ncbi:hypothetical protein O3G_MSEX001841 [Manduca sexta]|uniref:RDH13 n=1 Tax=Manduca sexta TaxID=7130 RepID=A0A921YLT9_MANSE|nr:hypothetical protein O3G_MSEX001841 [Manduca sexta]
MVCEYSRKSPQTVRLTVGICKCSKHLYGKVVIVTGANSGVGFETAKDLAARGARLILACRNEERGTTAREKIVSATGNNDVHYRHLDLASLASVRKFAADIIKNEKRVDILINNAGIFYVDNIKTEDNLFVGMQTNHFAPFLLTSLLLPLLKSSAPSRIINVASTSYMRSKIDFENLNMELENKDTYTCHKAYCMTKLCNVYTTLELDRRLRGTGVTVNCLHPGFVDTNIVTTIQWPLFRFIKPVVRLTMKSAWEGAQTSIYLAVAPELENVSGHYFSDCRERGLTKKAQDVDIAKKLWEVSESLVKLK